MQSVTHTLKKGDIEDTIIISGYDASDAMALITSLTGESVEDDYDFQDDEDDPLMGDTWHFRLSL